MVDDEQRDAFHLGGRREPQHRLALAVRAEPLERPSLVDDLALGVEHLQQAFVALRRGVGPLLRFVDDLARVVGGAQNRARGTHKHDDADRAEEDAPSVHRPDRLW